MSLAILAQAAAWHLATRPPYVHGRLLRRAPAPRHTKVFVRLFVMDERYVSAAAPSAAVPVLRLLASQVGYAAR
eukprot:6143050-Lingulodinium_polyedra.AAC.1